MYRLLVNLAVNTLIGPLHLEFPLNRYTTIAYFWEKIDIKKDITLCICKWYFGISTHEEREILPLQNVGGFDNDDGPYDELIINCILRCYMNNDKTYVLHSVFNHAKSLGLFHWQILISNFCFRLQTNQWKSPKRIQKITRSKSIEYSGWDYSPIIWKYPSIPNHSAVSVDSLPTNLPSEKKLMRTICFNKSGQWNKSNGYNIE